MKRFRLFFTLVLATASALVYPAHAVADSGPSASGHGNLTIAGELRTFSFTAVTHKDGSVTGEAQLDNRAQGVKLHLAIDCLKVVGNTATVSGTVTEVSGPTVIQVGWKSVFRVTDNGEGGKSAPDTISLVFSFAPPAFIDCHSNFSVPMMPIEGGNIQVRP
jgi:hypothetical protein